MNRPHTRPHVTAAADPGPQPAPHPAGPGDGRGRAPAGTAAVYVETDVPPGVTLHAWRHRNVGTRTPARIFGLTIPTRRS